MPVPGSKREKRIEVRCALHSIQTPKDIVLVTPEEFEKRRDIAGTIVRAALRKGLLFGVVAGILCVVTVVFVVVQLFARFTETSIPSGASFSAMIGSFAPLANSTYSCSQPAAIFAHESASSRITIVAAARPFSTRTMDAEARGN